MEASTVMETRLAAQTSALNKWEIVKDSRPSDYLCALMSNHVYQGEALKVGDTLPDQDEWKVVAIKTGDSEYFGALYFNSSSNHYVLAHRGTVLLERKHWMEDFKGIYSNELSPQKLAAYDFVQEAVAKAKESKAGLTFTGHSLGAFLAELSVFYCHRSLKFPAINAVTFESPGSFETLDL